MHILCSVYIYIYSIYTCIKIYTCKTKWHKKNKALRPAKLAFHGVLRVPTPPFSSGSFVGPLFLPDDEALECLLANPYPRKTSKVFVKLEVILIFEEHTIATNAYSGNLTI